MLRACKRAAACRSRRRIHATQAAFSTASYSFPPASSSEKADEDWREVGVFWDIENCHVPSGVDPFVIRPNIERALRTSGFLGPIYVAGYANINTLCRGHTLESLSESGIAIHHVPSGGRDASDRALLIDVMFWTMKHTPPAHVLLITGDSDFSVLMHKLRLLGYNVLLASPYNKGMSSSLLHAASKIWIWPDVIVGISEGLIAETHIPGTPLPENLVSKKKESGSKSSMDLHEDSGHECVKDVFEGVAKVKLRDGGWLPPYVVDRIVNFVKDRPGITLGELTKELKAININPKLYGYYNYYHCLSRMDQLETQYIDGVGMRESVIFNVSSHLSDKTSDVSPGKDSSVSFANSDHKDNICNELSVSADGKGSTKKGSDQEKIIASDTQQSWGSRLLSFFKGN